MPELNNKKILIVDDDESLLSVLVDSFTLEGFTVISAINGEIALDLAFKEHPDLILLDNQMPVMGGLEMLDRLRDDEWGKSVKVILLTNYSDMEKIAEAAASGAYEYLVKNDWKVENIIKKVKSKLSIE